MKNVIRLFFGLLMCWSGMSAYAQSQPPVAKTTLLKGVVVKEESLEPLAFATVVIFSAADSAIRGNSLTGEAGDFRLEVRAGDYYLILRYLGYAEKVVSNIVIRADQAELDLGQIVLQSTAVTLGTVEIESERSQMELRLDKRVFNVGQDLTGAGNTAADILNNIPSVTVDPEGVVSLRGSQGVRILVDGKPSALLSSGDPDALRRMQGDVIESVELITNPSARYEAEGEAGIINIILKKNKKRGINGSFGANAGYPDNYGASYSLNYRRENLNFFSNFGINYRRAPGGGNASQRFFDQGRLDEYYTSETSQLRGGLSGNLQMGTDWYINERNVLTGSLLYRRSKEDNEATVIYRDLGASENLINETERENLEASNSHNFETALSYKRTFPQKDREWTVDFKHILDDDLEESDYFQTNMISASPLLQRSSNTEYETNTLFQTDYIHPFNDSTRLEMGLRTALRTIRNRFLVEEQDEIGSYFALSEFDDELKYTENIYAAYLMGSKEWRKIGIQAGLRAELSDVDAILLLSGAENNQYYFNTFPSAAVSYRFSAMRQLQASYSRRLSRPYFRLLLPFSNFTDPRNNLVGNPTLRPEYTDAYELSFLNYLERGSFLSSVYYRRTTGVIERLTLPADDGTTIRFPVNLAKRNAYGLELNFSKDLTDAWKVNADLNFYRARVDGSYEGIDYLVDIFSWSGRINSNITLAKTLDLQASFDYRAPENNTQGRTLAIYAFDLGASLDVLAGKGTLTLSGRDLFNTRKERRIIDLPEYQAESVFQWRQARQVVLSFVYRLNQNKSGK
jgi:iron complex outermembrane recepter protein